MNKPANWDETPALLPGESSALPPGGYVCVVVGAKTEMSKGTTPKEMLCIAFDIAEGEYKDYYSKKFKENTAADKKWPNKGTMRMVAEGESTKFLKGFIEKSLEPSNPGYRFAPAFDEKTLKDKRFGGVFGRVEFFNSNKGEYQFATELRTQVTVADIQNGNFKIPADKTSKRDSSQHGEFFSDNPLDALPHSLEDEYLPF